MGLSSGASQREATKTARRRSHSPRARSARPTGSSRSLGLPVSRAASCSLTPLSHRAEPPPPLPPSQPPPPRTSAGAGSSHTWPSPRRTGRPPRSTAAPPRRSSGGETPWDDEQAVPLLGWARENAAVRRGHDVPSPRRRGGSRGGEAGEGHGRDPETAGVHDLRRRATLTGLRPRTTRRRPRNCCPRSSQDAVLMSPRLRLVG